MLCMKLRASRRQASAVRSGKVAPSYSHPAGWVTWLDVAFAIVEKGAEIPKLGQQLFSAAHLLKLIPESPSSLTLFWQWCEELGKRENEEREQCGQKMHLI
jgi:hypothetical protein